MASPEVYSNHVNYGQNIALRYKSIQWDRQMKYLTHRQIVKTYILVNIYLVKRCWSFIRIFFSYNFVRLWIEKEIEKNEWFDQIMAET